LRCGELVSVARRSLVNLQCREHRVRRHPANHDCRFSRSTVQCLGSLPPQFSADVRLA